MGFYTNGETGQRGGTNVHFNKPYLLRKWLPHYDWVLWLDMDTLVVDLGRPIEQFIEEIGGQVRATRRGNQFCDGPSSPATESPRDALALPYPCPEMPRVLSYGRAGGNPCEPGRFRYSIFPPCACGPALWRIGAYAHAEIPTKIISIK